MDRRALVVTGVHVVVGLAFVGLAIQGLRAGVEPAAAGLRFVLGVLVIGLGFAVARIL
jgi:hypothetical protein